MRVDEVMQREVKTIEPSESAGEAFAKMKLNRFHHLVVMERGRVVGVVSDRDLRATRGAERDLPVQAVMARDVVAVTTTTTLRQAANLMRGRSIGCLPVLQGKRLVGIVTTTDLLELIGRGDVAKPKPHEPKMTRKMGHYPRIAEKLTH